MTAGQFDAVVPVTMRDRQRAEILLASVERNMSDLGTLWVVSPDAEAREMADWLGDRSWAHQLADSDVVPELRALASPPDGWSIQQLVKLAMAEAIDADWYVTLDADVICTCTVGFSDLVVDGRGIANRRSGEPFRARWYDWAERVLDLPRSGHVHGVTPAVLNRNAVRELIAYLTAKADAAGAGTWREYLLDSLPWTEYSLYYSFLEATGRYEAYHFDGPGGKEAVYGPSVWSPTQHLTDFDLEAAFACNATYWFIVIQSTHPEADPATVWDMVRPYLDT